MKPTNQLINEANSIILAKDRVIENLQELLRQWMNDYDVKVKENLWLNSVSPKNAYAIINDLETELREEKDLNKDLNYQKNCLQTKMFEHRIINIFLMVSIAIFILLYFIF